LSARDEARGKEAIAKLESEGLHPKFHQLDINDADSIERLRNFLLDKYGGLDLLVNNAGIAYKVCSKYFSH
jgi:carbonyl reductase 1